MDEKQLIELTFNQYSVLTGLILKKPTLISVPKQQYLASKSSFSTVSVQKPAGSDSIESNTSK